MSLLVLKRASASRLSGEGNDDDYDVLADGTVVDRIMKTAAASVGEPWLWTLAFGHHEDRVARLARPAPRAFQPQPPLPIYAPQHCPSAYSSDRLHRALPPHQNPHAAVRWPLAA